MLPKVNGAAARKTLVSNQRAIVGSSILPLWPLFTAGVLMVTG